MQVEHSGGVKAMTDERIEQAIEALEGFLAKREAGANAKVIEGVAEPAALSVPRKPRRKTRKSDTRPFRPRRAEEDVAS
jgi:ketopantoate hydroxymethyltransferase